MASNMERSDTSTARERATPAAVMADFQVARVTLRTIMRPAGLRASHSRLRSTAVRWKAGGTGAAMATAGASWTTLRAAASAPATPVKAAIAHAHATTPASRRKATSGNW